MSKDKSVSGSSDRVILSLQGVSKDFAQGRRLLDNLTLGFFAGAKIGILGINGSGKSSLLRIMAGEDKDFSGDLRLEKGMRVGYLAQEPHLSPDKSVSSTIMEGLADEQALVDRFNSVSSTLCEEGLSDERLASLLEEQSSLQERIDVADAWNLSHEVEIASEALRCASGDSVVGTLSGGEKRRVALCRLLLSKPDILLLDEPTNHLDAETTAWLERHLRESKSLVVLVTHDRYFLDNVTGWILELDRGKGLTHRGNYSSWLSSREERLRQESRDEKSLLRAISDERSWIGKSRSARRDLAKSRISSYEERLQAAQISRPDIQRIHVPPGSRLGSRTVVFEDVSKSFGDRLLFEGL